MSCSTELITVCARNSLLSHAQVEEVLQSIRQFHPHVDFQTLYIETIGDKDQKTSLRTLEKTDFFTKEIDQLLLLGKRQIAIHSAKDLPEPLPKGLVLAALTKGVDPSDCIVLRECETFESLPSGAKIGTSSARREKNVRDLRSDLVCVDVRGNIQTRLSLLNQKVVDGLVMAEAALIRLKLTHLNRISLPGERSALQGQLAVIALQKDHQIQQLFRCIDSRHS